MVERGFVGIPDKQRFVLSNARIPACLLEAAPAPADRDGLVPANIHVTDGKVTDITEAGLSTDADIVDLRDAMAWPCLVDMHTHIDKGHIAPRHPNPDGTFQAALEAVQTDREANWTAEDVRRRMDFSLRCAYAHGTTLLRTHIDSIPPQHSISWPVFAETREEWAGRIALQAVALFAVDAILDDGYRLEITDMLRRHGGILGVVTYMVPDLDRALDRTFETAMNEGFDLDFHVDENEDPASRSLRHIADAALRHKFTGRIVVGHCCSLARQPAKDATETMARVRDAGIAVVSLPMCNMYLQDRHTGRTPRWRGVTLFHEMKALGIPVAVASDNTRDPFYAYGDLDPLEVFREAVRILQLDHPFGDWPAIIARDAATIVGRPELGTLSVGQPADIVLFKARNWTELLSRPQSDRTVLRSGKAIDRTLPDYRELDDIMVQSR